MSPQNGGTNAYPLSDTNLDGLMGVKGDSKLLNGLKAKKQGEQCVLDHAWMYVRERECLPTFQSIHVSV